MKWLAVFVLLFLVVPSYSINFSFNSAYIGKFEKKVLIKAGDDFYIHFSSNGIEFKKQIFNISYKEEKALAKSPEWIRIRLARQFESLDDEYADLILNAEDKYVDEIAFCIATCPINGMPSPSLLYDNAYFIYKNDEYLDYVDVIDFENGSSTVKYKMPDKEIICPMQIYYWYVVHPRITFEDAEYVYGKFWREYLFYHNDIGYPLLMEKLYGIKYLWDYQSYHPPSHRTWNWSMENHPTAIEAINYWIGKTVNQLAIGDRPGQPNVIAHEHNGFCGELQQIAVAAQRAALIPSVGINNLGEDHVWREFWCNGWHQCDNWWADGGGSVDNYDEYRYRWGKIVSSFFAWKGDSSIYDVTSKYIKQKDRARVIVEVKDSLGNAVDGVRVMVFGTWKANNFKNKLWNKYVDRLWQKLPEKLRERWENFYEKLEKFYKERVPGLIPWIIPSIWNYTNIDGKCGFDLGLGHSYLFVLQKDEFFYFGPYSIGKSNAIHYCLALKANSTKEIKIRFILPDIKEKIRKNIIPNKGDNFTFKLNFRCKGYQSQRNPWDWKYAYHETDAKIDFFVVDKENFEKYRRGEVFNCYEYLYSNNGSIELKGNELFFVFKNRAKRTDIILNFELEIYSNKKSDFIHITNEEINGKIIANAGPIKIEGYSTGEGELEIGNQKWNVYGKFEIVWNGKVGNYTIKAKCGDFEKEYKMEVVDYLPPKIVIEKFVANKTLSIKGFVEDDADVIDVYAYINEQKIELGEEFNKTISLPPGDYEIIIEAIDECKLKSVWEKNFAILGNKSKPLIENIWHEKLLPANVTVIYADVKPTFYKIKNVKIILNGEELDMYRYADNPHQPRHEEDALRNRSNEPVYGIELVLKKGTYKVIIKAIDTAGNEKIKEYNFQV